MSKNVEARLKIWLLRGREISHNQALRLFGTNRLAEYPSLTEEGHEDKDRTSI